MKFNAWNQTGTRILSHEYPKMVECVVVWHTWLWVTLDVVGVHLLWLDNLCTRLQSLLTRPPMGIGKWINITGFIAVIGQLLKILFKLMIFLVQ